MNDDILNAVIEIINDPSKAQFHGSFVNYLAEENYVKATFQADEKNLQLIGYYIKWREWLVPFDTTTSDHRAELNEHLAAVRSN